MSVLLSNMMQSTCMPSFVTKKEVVFFPDFEKYAKIREDLTESFAKHFQNLNICEKQLLLLQRPFSVKVEEITDAELQLKLMDWKSNDVMKDKYRERWILNLKSWLKEETYPVLVKNSRFSITWFGSTCRCDCEQRFSIMKLNESNVPSQSIDKHLDPVVGSAITLCRWRPIFPVSFKTNVCEEAVSTIYE